MAILQAVRTSWRSLTPLIASGPGVPTGEITHQLGHVVDLMPTLFKAAGLSYPDCVEDGPIPDLDGSSVGPIFRGKTREKPDLIIFAFQSSKRMYRLGEWKPVRIPGSKDGELYNLAKDPSEQQDLADQKPEVVKKLLKRVKKLKAERNMK